MLSRILAMINVWLLSLIEVEVELIYDRQSFGQSCVRHASGTRDQFLFLLEISFRQLRLCCFVAPSLTRGRVCKFTCTIASGPCKISHSWFEVPQNSRPYFAVSSETPPTWRARFPYLYPPGTGWPSYTPGHWVPFLSSLTTRRDYGIFVKPIAYSTHITHTLSVHYKYHSRVQKIVFEVQKYLLNVTGSIVLNATSLSV
jgi:hypothetical protein